VLLYRMQSEGPTPLPMRLKIEINSREHYSVSDLVERKHEVRSRWFSGDVSIWMALVSSKYASMSRVDGRALLSPLSHARRHPSAPSSCPRTDHRERVARKSAYRPLVERTSAKTTIDFERRCVPVEH
jgi:hypothetical protein